jgi:hypothetical protein
VNKLPEDGQVRPKHVAVDCDFNVNLNYGENVNRLALKMEVNVKCDTVANFHTLQITTAHAKSLRSAIVFASRFLPTDFKTVTITVSLQI